MFMIEILACLTDKIVPLLSEGLGEATSGEASIRGRLPYIVISVVNSMSLKRSRPCNPSSVISMMKFM